MMSAPASATGMVWAQLEGAKRTRARIASQMLWVLMGSTFGENVEFLSLQACEAGPHGRGAWSKLPSEATGV